MIIVIEYYKKSLNHIISFNLLIYVYGIHVQFVEIKTL